MKKTIILLFLFCLISSDAFAMRAMATAKDKALVANIKKAIAVRSEIRSKNISMLDINFRSSFKESVTKYFKDLGYSIERYNREDYPRDVVLRFDVVFWDVSKVENLRYSFVNVINLMREDGILFLSVKDENEARSIEEFAEQYNLSYRKEGDVIVVKRMFDDYKLFFQVVKDLKQIMVTEMAA